MPSSSSICLFSSLPGTIVVVMFPFGSPSSSCIFYISFLAIDRPASEAYDPHRHHGLISYRAHAAITYSHPPATRMAQAPRFPRRGHASRHDPRSENVRLSPSNMHQLTGTCSYSTHGSREKLALLDGKKLTPIVSDKDQRKTVLNALKGIASGQVGLTEMILCIWLAESVTKSFTKKRTRDSDLLEPLRPEAEEPLPQSLEFHEILDPEVLAVSLIILDQFLIIRRNSFQSRSPPIERR